MLTEDQTVILDALRNSSVVELQVWLKADIKACKLLKLTLIVWTVMMK
jgi:hypothetical protein